MIHENERAHHSSLAKRENTLHFHCIADRGIPRFNYNIEHIICLRFVNESLPIRRKDIIPFLMFGKVRLYKTTDRYDFVMMILCILECVLHNSSTSSVS